MKGSLILLNKEADRTLLHSPLALFVSRSDKGRDKKNREKDKLSNL